MQVKMQRDVLEEGFFVGEGSLLRFVPFDVEVLDLSRMPIRELPAGLERCVRLRELHVWNTQIELIGCIEEGEVVRGVRLPDSLRIVRAGLNQIVEVGQLPDGILELNLQNNKIERLGRLPASLEILYVDNNRLRELESVARLGRLTELYANENCLQKLPRLPAGLVVADISDNRLHDLRGLPESLECVYIGGNPLEDYSGLPAGLSELCVDSLVLPPLETLPRFLTSLYTDLDLPENQKRVLWEINNGVRAARNRQKDHRNAVAVSLLACCPLVQRGLSAHSA